MQKRRKFTASELARLDAHFCRHAAAVERFRHLDRGDVLRMWRKGVNERGEALTAFERQALIERHYERPIVAPGAPYAGDYIA